MVPHHSQAARPLDLALDMQDNPNHTFQPSNGEQIWCSLNLVREASLTFKATYRPPRKCLPRKNLDSGFGAVKLTSVAGWNDAPGPDFGGP